jgi:sec-independent protein translocase protein TatA
MFNQVGLPEVVIVLAIVLLIFGPKRLPQAGRALGKSMREFKDSISGTHKDDQELDAPSEETKTEPEKSASSDS